MPHYITGYRDPFWNDPRVDVPKLPPRPPWARTWQASSLRDDEGCGFGEACGNPSRSTYRERRVRVGDYGRLPRSTSLLVSIPTVKGYVSTKGGKNTWVACCRPQAKIHKVAAAAFHRMAAAIRRDLGIDLKVTTAWRPHNWSSRAAYEAYVIKKYGSVSKGKKYLAFNSPHETGLAMDIGSGGLWPTKSTIAKQCKTPLHKWLVAHAGKYGWHPYKNEPWHWEYPITKEAWQSGEGAGSSGQPSSSGPAGAVVGVALAATAAYFLLKKVL